MMTELMSREAEYFSRSSLLDNPENEGTRRFLELLGQTGPSPEVQEVMRGIRAEHDLDFICALADYMRTSSYTDTSDIHSDAEQLSETCAFIAELYELSPDVLTQVIDRIAEKYTST